MKEELDLLEYDAIKEKADNLKIKYDDSSSKEDLIFSIIKSNGGISKMKVNNQVASNPIGFYESSSNFCKLPCRLTHFTRTNYDKYNKGLPFIQRIDEMFKKLIPESYERQLERK